MAKYAMQLTSDQELEIALLRKAFSASSVAETIRRSLNLAVLLSEAIAKGDTIVIERGGKAIDRFKVAR